MQKLMPHEIFDAQLPRSLKQLFISKGHDCIHTLDLEKRNETPDKIINSISIKQQRIVITKDGDFYDSFLLNREPYKLILVKLGNTSRNELLQFLRLFPSHLPPYWRENEAPSLAQQ